VKRIVFTGVALFSALVATELSARVAQWMLAFEWTPIARAKCSAPPNLHAYQEFDQTRCIWKLRPGVHQTVGELIEEGRRQGRDLLVRHLEVGARELGVSMDAPAVRVNAEGLRGPEIDTSHARPRV
jgi:hypothetical protein